MICGWMIPLTVTYSDDACRFNACSEDYLFFMCNVQSLIFLLLFLAFNLSLCNFYTLFDVANSISMCGNLLQPIYLLETYCFYVVSTSILVLAAVCLEHHMLNSGVGFHLSVASFFFSLHKSSPCQPF
jgi:hypothetical protein